jgi:5-amino-6-(5-phospho-D-ribitylamino)uracil phosphatase
MKTLYVSDLDGTLFNSRKEISRYTRDVINRFIRQGGLFTIATARTSYGCDYRLADLDLQTPAILMNGVCLYSFSDKRYRNVQIIRPDAVARIDQVLDEHGVSGFLYTLADDMISIYYTNPEDLKFTQYYSERAREACAEIAQTESLHEAARDKDAIYLALTGERSAIEPAYNSIRRIPGIDAVMYLNIYNELYCLEAFNDQAGKASALRFLQETVKPEETVVFGDNHNDLGMMEIADRSYAPENAIPEVKSIVTGVIPHCDEDGVARFLEDNP